MTDIRIGPFRIHEVVGKGGMGVVHRGTYDGPGTSMPVAVKFVHPPDADTVRFREAFVREAQSAARLHHPNIVGVYDMGAVDEAVAESLSVPPETAYLVMEYVEGGTLENHVGRLRWNELRDVLLRLLDALAHAHALGIVHRDLKPANVLSRPHEREGFDPLLTDFGIARAMDSEPAEPHEDEPQRVAGTPYYMAPEHVMGRWRDEGPWTDVYALGALAWHLTTGTVPFAGNTGEVLRAHLMAELPVYVPIVEVPEGFEEWVRRLLDKDLSQRYRRAADAAWALMNLGDVRSQRASPVTPNLRAVIADAGPTLQGLTGSLSKPDEPMELKPDPRREKIGLAPPMPADWRRGDEADQRMLAGAGLGLFGLRPVPIVGRDAERTQLWDALRRVHRTGKPQGAMISGAPGSGKSRLVEWLTERSGEVGGAIDFRATHTESHGGSEGLVPMMARFTRTQGLPFESVLMRVRALYTDLDMRGEDVLFDGVALTERILGHNPENAQGPRFQSRREWFSALLRLFGGLTRERPVLLWLDDVHWSEESLEFARYVLSGEDEDSYPVFVVMTCPELSDTPGAGDALSSLRELASLPNVEQLQLEPLDDRDMRDLVRRMLGLTPEIAEMVVERTAGNPLFAVQIVEDWVAREMIELTDDGFVISDEHPLQLPDDVHATWQRRVREFVSRYNPPERAGSALVIAALLGKSVDVREWRHATVAAGLQVESDFVAKLVAAGLATRHEMGWSFVHGLLRESLLRDVEEELASYHRYCAEAIEATWDPPFQPRVAERVASHWCAAGEPRVAFDVLHTSIIAHRESAEHAVILAGARRAYELFEEFGFPATPTELGSLRLHLASSLRHLGDVDAARENMDAGWEILAEGLSPETYVDSPDPERNPLLASLLVEEAIMIYENEADPEQADTLLASAQQLAFAVDDPVSAGWTSKIRSRMLCTLGRLDEGVEAARTSVDYYGRLKNERPDFYFSGLCELAGALRVAGEYDEAEATMGRAMRWVDDVGSREALALAAMESAELARARERYDEARQHYRTCGELFDILGGKNAILVDLNLCLVDIEAGELDRPLPRLESLRTEFLELGMEGLTPHIDLAIAACCGHLVGWERYDEAFADAREKLTAAGVRDPELAGLAIIAAREVVDQSPERARAALELAEQLGGAEHHAARRVDLAHVEEALAGD